MNRKFFSLILLLALLMGCAAPSSPEPASASTTASQPEQPTQKPLKEKGQGQAQNDNAFNIDQALSDNAQRNTIAFSAIAYLTGDFNADTFYPPGKVADFWGFQYLRDNDPSGMGHNTDFLTYAALNMLTVLTPEQRAKLTVLAESQVDKINEYALKRFILIDAFRRNLEGDFPVGTTELDMGAVQEVSAEIYRSDGEITLERAVVMSQILVELTDDQRAYLDAMIGQGMTAWNRPEEPADLRGLEHDIKVNIMTYAGDMFSWYAGGIEADTYINPERQGTYFGAFYLKDAPAVGNPGYTIPSNLTADMGQAFIQILTPEQNALLEEIVTSEHPHLLAIVDTRAAVSAELRRSLNGETIDTEKVLQLMENYGREDGALVYYFARNFALINATLTAEQRSQLMDMRYDMLGDRVPAQPFLYSKEIPMPKIPNSDFLFK